ncbi:MAG TPA: hypothetical protein VN754_04400 [Candidatus Binataceae bacterium]|nr:hypothetical protein [Candidatus Binataceae bacterium]
MLCGPGPSLIQDQPPANEMVWPVRYTALRKQGRLVLVAAFEVETLPLSAFTTLIKELEVIATFWANALDFQRAIKLVASRKLDVRPLISARIGLEDEQRAFDGLVKDKNSQIKVLFSNL